MGRGGLAAWAEAVAGEEVESAAREEAVVEAAVAVPAAEGQVEMATGMAAATVGATCARRRW